MDAPTGISPCPQANLARQDTMPPIFSLVYNSSRHDSPTVERFYDICKNNVNGDRVTMHKVESYEGKMFVTFIALAVLGRLKSKLAEHRQGNNTLGRLLFRMSTLSKVAFKGRYKHIYSTPLQAIIDKFGLDLPVK